MNTLNELPTHFSEVQLSQGTYRDRKIGESPIEYKLTYVNNLSSAVTIEWRSGFKFTLPPERSLNCNSLVMRVEIVIHPKIKINVQEFLAQVDKESSDELQAMRESFTFQIQENKYGGATIVLNYPLNLAKLQEYGGSVYCNELDCVISLLSGEHSPAHPYSEVGKAQRIINSSHVTSDLGFGYSVELVDSAGRYGDRYLNIGNKVYRVVPKKDPTKRDGIYIISNHAVIGELSTPGVGVKHYSFEGAEDLLGLYRTAEQAMNLGDASLARKQELVSLEHQLALQKVELQNAKQQFDINQLERERITKERDAEREMHLKDLAAMRERTEHEMLLERQRIKDHYESKSHNRKDSGEALKFLPSLIIGIGAVFMALRTFMPVPAK